jgi:ligand-binding sensor domain-containing protein
MKTNSQLLRSVPLMAALSLSAWLLCSTSVLAQTTSFNFRSLTDADGLSDGVVHGFVQDQYGFIWIGTSYGLDRFDGINIKPYFHEIRRF